MLLGEPGAAVTDAALRDLRRQASRIAEVELHRVASREGVRERAGLLLEDTAIVPLTDAVLDFVQDIEPFSVGTLYAIHLATALMLGVDAIMTYDAHLAEGARHHGLPVLAPT